jgi:transcriptional regulator with XRE-family HTH domain
MKFTEKLGRKIQKAREKAKLTKTEAAAESKMSWRQWHLYETGQVMPSAERLFAIAKALGVTPGDLEP